MAIIYEKQIYWARAIEHDGHLFYLKMGSELYGRDGFHLTHVAPDKTISTWSAYSRSDVKLHPKKVDKLFGSYLEKCRESFKDGIFTPGEFPSAVIRSGDQPQWDPVKKIEPIGERGLACDQLSVEAGEQLNNAYDPEVLDYIRQKIGGDHTNTVESYNLLVQNPEYKRQVLDLFKRHPWFMSHVDDAVLWGVLKEIRRDWQSLFKQHPDDVVKEMLSKRLTSLDFIFQSDLSAIGSMAGLPAKSFYMNSEMGRFIEFYSALPSSWVNEWCRYEDVRDLNNVAKLSELSIIKKPIDIAMLLKGCKGDFDIIKDWFFVESDTYAELKMRPVNDLNDCLSAFANDVTSPLSRVAFHGTRISDNRRHEIIQQLTRSMLGFEGLKRLIEVSDRWHAIESQITESLHDGHGVTSWPALTDNYIASNGLVLIPLTTSRQLSDEGLHNADEDGIDGLGHCVGSYSSQCQSGRSHIFSVRQRDGRTWKRLSTVEFDLNHATKEIREVQHRSKNNRNPSKEALKAVDEWIGLLSANRISLNLDEVLENAKQVMQSRTARPDPLVTLQRGLDAWQPMLKSAFRGITAEELVMYVFEMDKRPELENSPRFGTSR